MGSHTGAWLSDTDERLDEEKKLVIATWSLWSSTTSSIKRLISDEIVLIRVSKSMANIWNILCVAP